MDLYMYLCVGINKKHIGYMSNTMYNTLYNIQRIY